MAIGPGYNFDPSQVDYISPEQAKSDRDRAQRMLGGGQQPVKHWTQGVSNMVNALMGGRDKYNLDQRERGIANAQTASAFNQMPGGLGGGLPGGPPPGPTLGAAASMPSPPEAKASSEEPDQPTAEEPDSESPTPTSSTTSEFKSNPTLGAAKTLMAASGSAAGEPVTQQYAQALAKGTNPTGNALLPGPGQNAPLPGVAGPQAHMTLHGFQQMMNGPNPLLRAVAVQELMKRGQPQVYETPYGRWITHNGHTRWEGNHFIQQRDQIGPIKKAPFEGTWGQPGPEGVPTRQYIGGGPGQQGTPPAVSPAPQGSTLEAPGAPEPVGPNIKDLPDYTKSVAPQAAAPEVAGPGGMLATPPPATPQAAAPTEGAIPPKAALPSPNAPAPTAPVQQTAPVPAPAPQPPTAGTEGVDPEDLKSLGQLRSTESEGSEQGKEYVQHRAKIGDASNAAHMLAPELENLGTSMRDPRFMTLPNILGIPTEQPALGIGTALQATGITKPYGRMDPAANQAFNKSSAQALVDSMRQKLGGLGQVRVAELLFLMKSLPSADMVPEAREEVLRSIQKATKVTQELDKVSDFYDRGLRLNPDGSWVKDAKGNIAVSKDPKTSTGLQQMLGRFLDNQQILTPSQEAKYHSEQAREARAKEKGSEKPRERNILAYPAPSSTPPSKEELDRRINGR